MRMNEQENPFEASASAESYDPPQRMMWSTATVLICALIGGVLGMAIGMGSGTFAPDYYFTIYANNSAITFDPVQLGMGLGLTQGVVLGGVIGLAIVTLHVFYGRRRKQSL